MSGKRRAPSQLTRDDMDGDDSPERDERGIFHSAFNEETLEKRVTGKASRALRESGPYGSPKSSPFSGFSLSTSAKIARDVGVGVGKSGDHWIEQHQRKGIVFDFTPVCADYVRKAEELTKRQESIQEPEKPKEIHKIVESPILFSPSTSQPAYSPPKKQLGADSELLSSKATPTPEEPTPTPINIERPVVHEKTVDTSPERKWNLKPIHVKAISESDEIDKPAIKPSSPSNRTPINFGSTVVPTVPPVVTATPAFSFGNTVIAPKANESTTIINKPFFSSETSQSNTLSTAFGSASTPKLFGSPNTGFKLTNSSPLFSKPAVIEEPVATSQEKTWNAKPFEAKENAFNITSQPTVAPMFGNTSEVRFGGAPVNAAVSSASPATPLFSFGNSTVTSKTNEPPSLGVKPMFSAESNSSLPLTGKSTFGTGFGVDFKPSGSLNLFSKPAISEKVADTPHENIWSKKVIEAPKKPEYEIKDKPAMEPVFQNASPFKFGAPTTTAASSETTATPLFTFGNIAAAQKPNETTSSNIKPFFSTESTPSSAIAGNTAFGWGLNPKPSNPQVNPSFDLGIVKTTANSTPFASAFGGASATPSFQFGASATPVFGATNTVKPTNPPAFGSSSSTSAPTFWGGTTAATVPASAGTTISAPVFGSTTVSTAPFQFGATANPSVFPANPNLSAPGSLPAFGTGFPAQPTFQFNAAAQPNPPEAGSSLFNVGTGNSTSTRRPMAVAKRRLKR
ncbi:hypothetical protein HDE_05373 [Halotydeus destructor]|nr:hypothetical protein HDE_05373 [Halotydeus destructor]